MRWLGPTPNVTRWERWGWENLSPNALVTLGVGKINLPTRWGRWALGKLTSQRVGDVGRWENKPPNALGMLGVGRPQRTF